MEIKEVYAFKTTDGSLFEDKNKAEEYERKWQITETERIKIEKIMKKLHKAPDTCDFANGSGFIQQKTENVLEVRKELLIITEKKLDWWFKEQKQKHNTDFNTVHPSWILRMLDGSCPPLERAWSRILCIDTEGKEWGQQYYATHQNEAKQVCLNAK